MFAKINHLKQGLEALLVKSVKDENLPQRLLLSTKDFIELTGLDSEKINITETLHNIVMQTQYRTIQIMNKRNINYY
jgi:hypothetical protein